MRSHLPREAATFGRRSRAMRMVGGGLLLALTVVIGILEGHGQQRVVAGPQTAQRQTPPAEAGGTGQGEPAGTVAPQPPAPPAGALSQEERRRLIDQILSIRFLERQAAQHTRYGRENLLAAEGHRGQYAQLSDEELRRCAQVAQKERQSSSGGRNTWRLLNEAMIAAGCPAVR
jgi:hypothetical protein